MSNFNRQVFSRDLRTARIVGWGSYLYALRNVFHLPNLNYITKAVLLSLKIPCSPCDTILSRTNTIFFKHRLVSVSYPREMYLPPNIEWDQTRIFGTFPCGGTQHVRRMRSTILCVKFSILVSRAKRFFLHSMWYHILILTGQQLYFGTSLPSL